MFQKLYSTKFTFRRSLFHLWSSHQREVRVSDAVKVHVCVCVCVCVWLRLQGTQEDEDGDGRLAQ